MLVFERSMSMPPSKYVSVSCSLFHVPILANLFAEGEVDGQNSGSEETRHATTAML